MIDLTQGKIYKVVDKVTGNVYIGSTCMTLERRLYQHAITYNRYISGIDASYCSVFDVMCNDDYEIVLVEDYPCTIRDALHKREGHYQRTIPCVNKNISGRSVMEYKNARFNCKCGGKYTYSNKRTHERSLKHQQGAS